MTAGVLVEGDFFPLVFWPPLEERLGITLPVAGRIYGAIVPRGAAGGRRRAGDAAFSGLQVNTALPAPPWKGRAVGLGRRLLPPEPAACGRYK